MPISNERLEAAARAVGQALGYEFTGASVLEATSNGDALCRQWEKVAFAALRARAPGVRRQTN